MSQVNLNTNFTLGKIAQIDLVHLVHLFLIPSLLVYISLLIACSVLS